MSTTLDAAATLAPHAVAPHSIVSVMEAIARDCLKALSIVQTYLPAASTLATLIFPQAEPSAVTAATVIALVENAIALVEAKWAAGGEASKTGPQKLADVMALVEGPLLEMLPLLGIKADTAYITELINAIVAILNLSRAPATA
jgi:hypothetical protein